MSGMHKIHVKMLSGEHAVIELPEEGRTVALLTARVQAHFGRDSFSQLLRLRLFFGAVELKDGAACLDDLGVIDGSELTLVFEDCDWRKRQDGRIWCGEDKSEIEVFGEVKHRSTEGHDLDNYVAIPVQITGNEVEGLKPIKCASDVHLTDALSENLRRCGYYGRLSLLQKHSIPIMLSGRDLMVHARTGSGKTFAALVPCFESLLRSGPPPNPGRAKPKPMPCGLMLVSTRELAQNIQVEVCKFSYDTGIRCCTIYGGADMREQMMDLERGCDILLATPCRLVDFCDRGRVSLELVQFFIVEEADRMLDMGWEPQVRQIVEHTNMGGSSAHIRQSMMLSETFTREVQVMARDFLNDYVLLTVGQVGSDGPAKGKGRGKNKFGGQQPQRDPNGYGNTGI